MPVKRLLATIALTLTIGVPTIASVNARDSNCDVIAGYIEMVDTRIAEEMHALVTERDWATDAQVAAEILNTGDVEDITAEELDPLIAYIGIPGSVLSEIDPADVPEGAMSLHESATDYWVASAGLMEGLTTGETFAYLEPMETATEENLATQDDISAQCPEIPESYEDDQNRLDTRFTVLDGEADPAILAESSLEDLDGMGYFFLFFGEEEAVAEPVVASTPATVSTPEN